MQNKGAIRLFAIVFALICVYQISFTLMTRKVERDAVKFANGDPVKERKYLDSISNEVVYNFIWLRKYTYMECKEREINLGLDLKGGMNVVLEVSVEDVIKSLAAPHYLSDPVFTKALNQAISNKASSQLDFVDLFVRAFEEQNPGGKLAQFFMTPESRGTIDLNTQNPQVVEYLRREAESAISNSFNVLRNRIDRFGVVQPNIQRLERQGRILIELPGVSDPERVTKLLTGTANLEFWATYETEEVLPYLQEANNILKGILETEGKVISADTARTVPGEKPQLSLLDQKQDTGVLSILGQKDSAASLQISEEDQARKENPFFSIVIPYLDNQGQPVRGSVVGIVNLRDTSKVNEIFRRPQIRNLFPGEMKFYWSQKPVEGNETFVQLHALKTSREKGASLSGRYITDANMAFGQFKGEAEVHMSMNAEGAKRWANLTRENVGRCLAIVLDDAVVSAPVVNSEIKGGSSTITGNFTQTEATDLANILKSGKMPARARIESSEVIGPSLGQASIIAGLKSFIGAFIIILTFMMLYYNRRAGFIVDIALVANMFFLIGVLASLQAVLTLPGIAGIVLTLGMSVDANIIIYERIREELTAGKGIKLAIADGYKQSYSAIIDGNVTTFLTGVILYTFGTGPIKGFATTLIIGIVTSLFSAIFITRLIYERLLAKNEDIRFSTRLTQNAFKNIRINFIGIRKYFYILSGGLILIGLIALFTRGLIPGVDFTGGRNYIIQFPQEVNTLEIREILTEQFKEAPSVITFGTKDKVRITTKFMIDSDDPAVDSIIKAKIFAGIQPLLGSNARLDNFISSDEYVKSVQKVGPTIASDMKVRAYWAIVLSLLVVAGYIVIRFRNWQFGMGALVSLAHDALMTILAFAVFHGILPFTMEVDQNLIAAVLTIVGYSINDTVVVFDRIRENRHLFRKRSDFENMNSAMNSTLSRTILTNLTVLLTVLILFVFGGDVLRGFSFALLVGTLFGSYSSVFIAAPIVYDSLGRNKRDTAQ